jgi:TetR/AcrR family transcriptional regulator, mexJK operon transcriptional repressor
LRQDRAALAERRVPSRRRVAPRRGGRPTRDAAERLGAKIIEIATELFLSEGYGATSIETIARRARIAKRTFYSRFRDKAELFGAVVHHVVERLRPQDDTGLFDGATLEESLTRLAQVILHAALSREALALHRVIVAEAPRFPELAAVVSEQSGRAEAVDRIAALLQRAAGADAPTAREAAFAAAQFLQMVVALPQRRALGLGTPMSSAEITAWTRDTVALFLTGFNGRLRGAR